MISFENNNKKYDYRKTEPGMDASYKQEKKSILLSYIKPFGFQKAEDDPKTYVILPEVTEDTVIDRDDYLAQVTPSTEDQARIDYLDSCITALNKPYALYVLNSEKKTYELVPVIPDEIAAMNLTAEGERTQERLAAKTTRDKTLRNNTYTLPDGSVFQTRPQDLTRIKLAIDNGTDINWVLKDNSVRLTTVQELKTILKNGREKYFNTWSGFTTKLKRQETKYKEGITNGMEQR